MRRKNDKNTEFDHFEELSNEWWNPNGKFKVLHTLTPLRIKYLINNINLISNNKPKNNKILKGLEILDLGCGGGLVCEPLARLGANVVVTGTGRNPDSFPPDEKAIGWKDVESVADQIREHGRKALTAIVDVTNFHNIQDLFLYLLKPFYWEKENFLQNHL